MVLRRGLLGNETRTMAIFCSPVAVHAPAAANTTPDPSVMKSKTPTSRVLRRRGREVVMASFPYNLYLLTLELREYSQQGAGGIEFDIQMKKNSFIEIRNCPRKGISHGQFGILFPNLPTALQRSSLFGESSIGVALQNAGGDFQKFRNVRFVD